LKFYITKFKTVMHILHEHDSMHKEKVAPFYLINIDLTIS